MFHKIGLYCRKGLYFEVYNINLFYGTGQFIYLPKLTLHIWIIHVFDYQVHLDSCWSSSQRSKDHVGCSNHWTPRTVPHQALWPLQAHHQCGAQGLPGPEQGLQGAAQHAPVPERDQALVQLWEEDEKVGEAKHSVCFSVKSIVALWQKVDTSVG